MDIRHSCALALLVAGVAVLVLSALALAVLPGPYMRLHALAPATSLGLPLVCLALAVETGPGRAAAKLVFIGLLAAVPGPVTSITIGRAVAQAEGLIPKGPPS
jgi:monovalent cation/proton antiporter MnhG/PhaG subunit